MVLKDSVKVAEAKEKVAKAQAALGEAKVELIKARLQLEQRMEEARLEEAKAAASGKDKGKSKGSAPETPEELAASTSSKGEGKREKEGQKRKRENSKSSSSIKAAPASAADSKPAQGTNSQSPQDMAELRRVRIMGQLKNVTDPKEKLKMIQLVKDNYVKRQNGATPESEEAAKAVYAMLAAMMKEYMPKGGPPPKGPPPARLLEKMEAGAARSPRTQGEASGKGMQLTSSLALHRDNEELHNIPPPTRSALKRKGAPPLENNVRIQWQNMQIDPAADPVAARYEVKSYKMNSELWFQMPGAHVTCDKCENSVPQSMGQLQGVQDGSQFAQNAFYCNDCLRNGIGD